MRTNRRLGLLRPALAGVLLAVAVLAVVGNPFSPQLSPGADDLAGPPAIGHDFVAAQLKDGEFCPGQTLADSVDVLAASSSAPMWMPEAETASRSTLERALMCGATPTLVFKSGVSVAFEPGWQLDDPEQRWTDMAAQWGGDVRTILGTPSYVFDLSDKSEDPSVQLVPGAEPASEVLLVLDDTLVRILGTSIPAADLVQVGNSIKPNSPIVAIKK